MSKRMSLLAAWVAVACALALPAAAKPPTAPKRPLNDVSKNKNSYQVGYAHLDTQWRWSFLDTIGQYLPKTLHDNFALFERYPDYVFNFTGSRRYLMMKQYYPSDYATMKEYVRKGRWYPTGSSVDENDVNTPSPESIIRNVLYGNHYFQKEFGFAPTDYILPDCFGFPASLPSILAHAGAKGFSTQKLTWGSAAGIPFTVGVWQGMDGKSVIAALDGGSYSARVTQDLSQSQTLLDRINKIGDQSGAYVDYRYYGTGDTGGSPTDESVAWIQHSLKSGGPVKIISAPADQMFMDLTKQQISKLPRYRGDLELTQHSAGSLTSQAYMKRWNRKNELLADSAERASVAAEWLGGTPYPRDKFMQSWYLILGNQMHDIIPGTSIPKAYELSWNDEVVALNQSAETLTNAVGVIARGMDTRAKGVPVVIYNPLSIDRTDVVDATVTFPGPAPRAVRVYGPAGEVASQVLGRSGNAVHLLFLASAPSVGVAAYDVRPATAPYPRTTGLSVTKSTLDSPRYKVTLNGDGDVAQVYDKAARRNMLSAPARLAFKFEEPQQYPAWNMDWEDQSQPPTGYVTGPATVRVVESGPVRVALEVTRKSQGSTFVQRIRLAAGGAGNRVEFDNAIDWNTMKHNVKAVFPMAVSNPMATYNLGFGTIKRGNNDPKKYEVVSRQWFDLTNPKGDYGVSVLEDSKYGSDKPDDGTLRLTLIRTPSTRSYPDQATQDLGRHDVLYALAGHKGDWRQGKSHWEGARLNQPLTAFQTRPHAGSLGRAFSLVTVNTDRVQVTALKKAEDSNEVVVRLQEVTGAPVKEVRLSASKPIYEAREVNGQEQPLGGATVRNGALVTSLAQYGARAFALTLGAPPVRLSEPKSAPISLPYDLRAATLPGEAATAGFDGKGHTIAADLLPATLVSEGVTFKMAQPGRGRNNAVRARGQKLGLPGGAFRDVIVLAASTGGDQNGTFLVDGRPVRVKVQDWGGYIGQWDNRVFTPELAHGASLLEGNIYGLQPAFIKRDPVAWVGEHRHTADGGNDIYAYSYIYKYRIPVAASARTLTLPDNPAIRIFAITAAANPNDDTRPAQYLYDTFQQPKEAPSISPKGGSFADSVEVTLRPTLYITNATLRYTTDGTSPTALSPVYQGPLTLNRNTVIKACSFGADVPGPVSTATFQVNDTTPPVVTGVSAMAGSEVVRLAFSEPLDTSSASRASAYGLSSGAVRSIVVSPDGRTVALYVDPVPEDNHAYTLTLAGLKDRSPAGNPVKVDSVPFTVAVPGYRFPGSETVLPEPGGDDASAAIRVAGAKPEAATGPTGPALAFTGTEGVQLSDEEGMDPEKAVTVSVWVKPGSWDRNPPVLSKGRGNGQYSLFAEDGHLAFHLEGAGDVQAPLPALDAWHHIAATYDGSWLRLYVDGVLASAAPASGTLRQTRDALTIGNRPARGGRGGGNRPGGASGPAVPPGYVPPPTTAAAQGPAGFIGQISDVRIYDQALLPQHVLALAREGAKG